MTIESPYRALEPQVELDQLRETVAALRREVKELRALVTEPAKWEHTVVNHQDMDTSVTAREFDTYGADGWELVNATDYNAYFKRRVGIKG